MSWRVGCSCRHFSCKGYIKKASLGGGGVSKSSSSNPHQCLSWLDGRPVFLALILGSVLWPRIRAPRRQTPSPLDAPHDILPERTPDQRRQSETLNESPGFIFVAGSSLTIAAYSQVQLGFDQVTRRQKRLSPFLVMSMMMIPWCNMEAIVVRGEDPVNTALAGRQLAANSTQWFEHHGRYQLDNNQLSPSSSLVKVSSMTLRFGVAPVPIPDGCRPPGCTWPGEQTLWHAVTRVSFRASNQEA
ncbi:hypothetical protein QR685DRAFT_279327 [Neurospora intermedia]|uniref:Post-SET domain-containing protein n=1 Tax=Neurospora intermedia TaxID=5142 RepID=A0ABR3DEX5_NEUIN